MRAKPRILIILFLCLFAVNGFAQKGKLTIKEANNGKTFTITKGQVFDILFKQECVGCQYVWTIGSLDSGNIKTLPSTYSNKSCQNCTGGNQDHTFHFKALKRSTTKLFFTYGEKQFAVTIKVKG